MFTSIIIFAYAALCVSGKLVGTFKYDAPRVQPSPTLKEFSNSTETRTITIPLDHVQTSIPQFQKAKIASGNITSDASNAAAASGFGTSCCGWGGVFGWTGTGASAATLIGNCGPGLPLSSLDLNRCISWDQGSGWLSCSTSGGFLSNGASGCRIISPPSVWGNAFGALTYTNLIAVCNGPAANTGYVNNLELNDCIGVTSSGQLTC